MTVRAAYTGYHPCMLISRNTNPSHAMCWQTTHEQCETKDSALLTTTAPACLCMVTYTSQRTRSDTIGAQKLGPAKSPLRGIVARLAGRHGLVEGRGAGVGQVVAGRVLDDAVEAVGEEHALAERVAQRKDVDVLRGRCARLVCRGCNMARFLQGPPSLCSCLVTRLFSMQPRPPVPLQFMQNLTTSIEQER